MSKKTLNVLKSYFETGDRPTEQQFIDFLDSFIHKDTGVYITNYSFNSTSGLFLIEFSDETELSFVIPQNADISFINGLQTALNNKVDKISGKGLSSNDYTNNERAIVLNSQSHQNDENKHVNALKDFTWSNKLTEWTSGREILFTGKNTYVIFSNAIYKLNILTSEYPYTTGLNFDFTKWIQVLDFSDKLDKGGYTGTAQDIFNAIQEIDFNNLTSNDNSIRVDGLDISNNISDFEDEFIWNTGDGNTFTFSFTPTHLLNVFCDRNGVTKRLLKEEFDIILPNQIQINFTLQDGDVFTLQYQHYNLNIQ